VYAFANLLKKRTPLEDFINYVAHLLTYGSGAWQNHSIMDHRCDLCEKIVAELYVWGHRCYLCEKVVAELYVWGHIQWCVDCCPMDFYCEDCEE